MKSAKIGLDLKLMAKNPDSLEDLFALQNITDLREIEYDVLTQVFLTENLRRLGDREELWVCHLKTNAVSYPVCFAFLVSGPEDSLGTRLIQTKRLRTKYLSRTSQSSEMVPPPYWKTRIPWGRG